MKKLLFLSLICLAVSACQDTRFIFSNNVPAQPSYTRTMHYTFWGKKATVDPIAVCGSSENIAMVEEKEKTHQSWMRWLTCDIYHPITVNVYCKRPVRSGYQAQQPRK